MTTPLPPSAAASLFEQGAWLRALARRLVRDEAQADDLVQETWEAALKHPPSPDLPARPWLAEVLRNVLRMRLRADGRRQTREQAAQTDRDTFGHPMLDPEQLVARAETQQRLAALVLALDEPFRATLLAHFQEGLSSAEIAAQTGAAAGTVRWRLSEGLDRLRAALDREHRGDRDAWRRVLVPIAALPAGRGAAALKGAMTMAGLLKGAMVVGGVVLAVLLARSNPGRRPSPTRTGAATAGVASSAASVGTPPNPTPTTHTIRVSPQERARLLSRLEEARHQGSAPSAPGVDEPAQLDKDYIRAQIQSLRPMIKECYEHALADHPTLAGQLMVEFSIVGDPEVGGVVTDTRIVHEDSTLTDEAVEECVTQTMYAAAFPAPAGGGHVGVRYPFVFTPDE
jgi:RNA polymerase sigma-70 factor (ECF subfamily)